MLACFFIAIFFAIVELCKNRNQKLNQKLSFLNFWNPPQDQTKAALEGKAVLREDVEKQTIEYQVRTFI